MPLYNEPTEQRYLLGDVLPEPENVWQIGLMPGETLSLSYVVFTGRELMQAIGQPPLTGRDLLAVVEPEHLESRHYVTQQMPSSALGRLAVTLGFQKAPAEVWTHEQLLSWHLDAIGRPTTIQPGEDSRFTTTPDGHENLEVRVSKNNEVRCTHIAGSAPEGASIDIMYRRDPPNLIHRLGNLMLRRPR